MTRNEMIIKYIEILHQKASSCHKQIHQVLYLFVVFSVFFYLTNKFGVGELRLMDNRISLPVPSILSIAPIILSCLFYAFVSFVKLEGLYYREIRRQFKCLESDTDFKLSGWQFTLSESPSFYTWDEICRNLNTSVLLGLFGKAFSIMIKACIVLVLPLIIIWFLYLVFDLDIFPFSRLFYIVCFLLIVFSVLRLYQRLRGADGEEV